MASGNLTWVPEFVFLGLSQTHELHLFLFLVFLLVYTTTVMGNLLIMVTVTSDSRLHTFLPARTFLQRATLSHGSFQRRRPEWRGLLQGRRSCKHC